MKTLTASFVDLSELLYEAERPSLLQAEENTVSFPSQWGGWAGIRSGIIALLGQRV